MNLSSLKWKISSTWTRSGSTPHQNIGSIICLHERMTHTGSIIWQWEKRCRAQGQHKNFIGKVMFLFAVGRPIYNDAGNCIFDGKLGVWPFVRKVQHSTLVSLSYINFWYSFVIPTLSLIYCRKEQNEEAIIEGEGPKSLSLLRWIELLWGHTWLVKF